MNAMRLLAALLVATSALGSVASSATNRDDDAGADWAVSGRTSDEQHYSPLAQIDSRNVQRLGLAWSIDLGTGNSVSEPLAVDGVLYYAVGYSVVHAVDAATGKPIWSYDPQVTEVAGRKLRQGWGIRGIAYSDGRIFVGTHDGRLLAIDASAGKPIWSAMTLDPDNVTFISGAPRVFDGKVIIGFGGADVEAVRGYVTAYDASTGKQLWRFYTVPGDPSRGFENAAMKMAAQTWAGEWWKYGGGGTVWHAMAYDRELNRIYLGVGNGSPWNRKVRSAGQGDNLFLASIVALDAKTGEYAWHYQVNPGESWDYNAAMDIELATLRIDGSDRRVLLHAPKNGFFYVIDRTNGRLISAEPFAKVNWASRIDLETGRPVELPGIRYENGGDSLMWPGPVGAHTWLPMSFNPQTGFVYLPVIELPAGYNDRGIDPRSWKRVPGGAVDGGVFPNFTPNLEGAGTSSLVAWDPVRQKSVWRIPTPGFWNGGTMTTAGGLVFQGQIDDKFNIYAADSGKLLWTYDARASVTAPPITYLAGGRQYVTVLTGMGTSGAAFGPLLTQFDIDYRTQARRVLTFALDGSATLPPKPTHDSSRVADPDFVVDEALASKGIEPYGRRCAVCHGVDVIAAGAAPDLRRSPVILSADAFRSIVQQGALVPRGMPRFEELSDEDLAAIRQYLRTTARKP